MVPFGGQGANMAILGALHLTNLLFDMFSNSQEEITHVFAEYHDMRRKPAKTSVDGSNKTGTLLHKKVSFSDSYPCIPVISSTLVLI
jgi:2-polyprenyl-6-methoxyphenol hydroxylase-like FAD-dependent oxidoreductase